MTKFNRKEAFSRTIGLVTAKELEVLATKRVAIGGLGGAGGGHLLTLTRLGIERFHIADLDNFAVENFNRQAGANLLTVDRSKVEVMAEMARAINPHLLIKTFPNGVTADNLKEFFEGVDVYVDGLDFFAFQARQMVFRYCYEKGIPAVTVGPIGMGAALVNFLPGKMSFDRYFNWKESDSDLKRAIKFLLGLTPKAPHRSYVVEPSAINLSSKKGPSTPMGCDLCAGVAGTEVLKILLGRGKVYSAPHSLLFDAYHNRIFHTRLWFGNRNPWQKLKIALAERYLKR